MGAQANADLCNPSSASASHTTIHAHHLLRINVWDLMGAAHQSSTSLTTIANMQITSYATRLCDLMGYGDRLKQIW